MQSSNPLIAVGISAIIVGSAAIIPAQSQSLGSASVNATPNPASLDPESDSLHSEPTSSTGIAIETMAIETVVAQTVALQVIEVDVGAIELKELPDPEPTASVATNSESAGIRANLSWLLGQEDTENEDENQDLDTHEVTDERVESTADRPEPDNQQALDRPVAYAMAAEATPELDEAIDLDTAAQNSDTAINAEVSAEVRAAAASDTEDSAAASDAIGDGTIGTAKAGDVEISDAEVSVEASDIEASDDSVDAEASDDEASDDVEIIDTEISDTGTSDTAIEIDDVDPRGETNSVDVEIDAEFDDTVVETVDIEETEDIEKTEETETETVDTDVENDTANTENSAESNNISEGVAEGISDDDINDTEDIIDTEDTVDTNIDVINTEPDPDLDPDLEVDPDREIDEVDEVDEVDELDPELEQPELDIDPGEIPGEETLPEEETLPIIEEEGEELESPDFGLTPATPPDYLNIDTNPLYFPTQPDEVDLIGTQPITLDEAIDLAVRNNQEIQQSRLVLERTQAALREAQALNYPNIDGTANLNFTASEQPETEPIFDPATGFPIGSEIDGTTTEESIGLGGAIQLSYPVYTSGRRPALIQAAERQVRLQELQLETDIADLVLQIIQSYYDLQQADEQTQIFLAALNEAERSLRDAEALERAGVGTRFDVLQAQVDVANALQDLRSQQSQQVIARERLAEQLNVPNTLTVSAAEPVEVAGVWELSLPESIVAAYQNRAELQQQLVQREIAERNRRAALAQLGPQVVFETSYSLNNNDLEQDEVGFLSNYQAQLGVSLNIFDGGEARAQARQAEANIAIAESEFANQRDQIRFEVEQAYSELDANFENIQTTALAVQQAEEALRLARLRFQAGVGTQTDVLRSQTELTRSRFNNLRAILDYNRALAALQRAVTNLPEGYLFDVP